MKNLIKLSILILVVGICVGVNGGKECASHHGGDRGGDIYHVHYVERIT